MTEVSENDFYLKALGIPYFQVYPVNPDYNR